MLYSCLRIFDLVLLDETTSILLVFDGSFLVFHILVIMPLCPYLWNINPPNENHSTVHALRMNLKFFQSYERKKICFFLKYLILFQFSGESEEIYGCFRNHIKYNELNN